MTSGSTRYVSVSLGEGDEPVELPVEEDGTLLLSVIQSQFEGSSGLKFRSPESGSWRGVRISNGVLFPPTEEGWDHYKYVVVSRPQPVSGGVSDEAIVKKERREERVDYREREPIEMGYKSGDGGISSIQGSGGYSNGPQGDLIVLGLKWDLTEAEMRAYFVQYGEIEHIEIKHDMHTGKSKGFGFLRYSDPSIQERVLRMTHTIKGRRCELKHPRKNTTAMPCKFFVGCLPNNPEATVEELNQYFCQFGRLSDVYIPKPYRGFGFVTYIDGYDAQRMTGTEHMLRGYKLNVSIAEPKSKTGTQSFGGYRAQPPVPLAQDYQNVAPAHLYQFDYGHGQHYT